MEFSHFLGKPLKEVENNIKNSYENIECEFIKVLSPKEDILGQDERVIKVDKKDKLLVYYSLF